MKKILALIMTLTMMFAFASCSSQSEEPIGMEPKVSQMKAICELSVMDCYYHNVAKYFEADAQKGFLGIGSKDKHFWVEYSGIVKLGIDVSLVKIEVNDTQITITLPDAKVLGCKVDSATLSEESFIVDEKSAKIEGEDEIKAFSEAQSKLEETASADKALLASAQQRAQSLLEDYVINIGNAVGKQYTIDWIYVDANGNTRGTASENQDSQGTMTEPEV